MHEIESLEEFKEHIPRRKPARDFCFQQLDLLSIKEFVLQHKYENCLFLGCDLDGDMLLEIQKHGNHVFPSLDVPFEMYQAKLYDKSSIYKGYDFKDDSTFVQSYDNIVYQHYVKTGKQEPHTIHESLARRMHDHSVTDALTDFIRLYDDKKIVAIMGGHSMLRTISDYKKVCLISKKLTELGYLMISGGGPGAMEATHVGAWFAGRNNEDLQGGLDILAEAPSYKDSAAWLRTSFEVMEYFPQIGEYESLGIPTWLYGHEPPTPFATKIAKYFANSVREEGLLAIAKGGVIYSPGSAGTIQEIFQDACQNHYISYEYPSPMVFMNQNYWTKERPIYPLLESLSKEGKYKNLILSLYDEVDDIVNELERFV